MRWSPRVFASMRSGLGNLNNQRHTAPSRGRRGTTGGPMKLTGEDAQRRLQSLKGWTLDGDAIR
jgi:hypothetical protein